MPSWDRTALRQRLASAKEQAELEEEEDDGLENH